ncbi:MAG: SEL1-like repeat protein, partial [Clostridia bacterium]|nr:SEL1-like repeat protein [Clostridia bacterium]
WQCRLNRCAADNGDAEAKYNLSKFYHYQPNKSLEFLTEAAEQGYAKAQCELGTYYCEQKNFTEAVKWFSLAGSQYAKASSALGKMYLNGSGVKKDLQKAIVLFENAAKCGDPEAYLYLARAYENGEGKENDYAKAIEYYSVAAVLGNEQARERLNTAYYWENENNIKKLKSLAKKGNAYAIYALSCFWDASGDELSRERDAKKAAEIWKKQADGGKAEAQYLSGLCYLEGTGAEQDAKKALDLFEKAAENGYVHALTEIGDMYKHGNGVEFSDKKGNEYHRKAAELGDLDAMTSLGRTYCEGYGVKTDIKKGVEWLKKAASEGDSDAYTLLAYWLDKLGEKENARAWRIKAAALGETTAQYYLAENLLKGTKSEHRLKDDDVKIYLNDFFYYDKILDAIKGNLPI